MRYPSDGGTSMWFQRHFLVLLTASALVSACMTSHTSAADKPIRPGDTVEVISGPAPLKAGTKVITTVQVGATFPVTKVRGDWVMVSVKTETGQYTGWLHMSRVKLISPDDAPAPPVPPERPKALPKPSTGKVRLPQYALLHEEVTDNAGKTAVALTILVRPPLTEEALRALLTSLYEKTWRRGGFKYHNTPTQVYIYAYSNRERAEGGTGLQAGMLERATPDDELKITIWKEMLSADFDKPQVRLGLSEQKRRQLWKELISAEDEASRIARTKYPLTGLRQAAYLEQLRKQGALQDRLNEVGKAKIAKKYGLTQEQLLKIGVEGGTKGWEMPPARY